ncbi:hypothetical protein [Enterococcus sp.]|uniref:hypothetical protein n=1 Tax=Enterococcus sp. TaxID=35783 RepID=UPI0029077CDE|nr:hypothetical protein [Enterococcus sp.]MDU5333806.1 hypothetical protein [Enterococcus sp.]
MERIHKINKLLMITYNLGGLCLMMIGGMVGLGGVPNGYVPTGIKVVTGLVFGTMIIAHIVRYILEKRLEKTG